MQRGESTIATSGLLLSAIILVGMSAAGWWSSDAQRRASASARLVAVETVAGTLTEVVPSLLEHGDVSTVRRVVADVAREQGLEVCRVVLPDGGVLAAERPSRITRLELPETWTSPSSPAPLDADGTADTIELRSPVAIPGRGTAIIHVQASTQGPGRLWADTQFGIGLIGAGCLLALLLVYRNLRRRLRAMAFIRDALLALETGVNEEAALSVRDDLGPEAVAWNELLSERARFQDVLVTRRLLESSTARQDRQSNLTEMCDAMSQGLILVDDGFNVRYGNGAAAFYLGVERSAMLGADVEPLLGSEKVRAIVRDVASGAERRPTAVEAPQGDGESAGVLRFSVRPVRHDDAGSAMIVIEDVTQQHVMNESRQSFIAHVTHELRTPLSNILLYVETAMEHGQADPAEQANCLNIINQEARRLDRIVADMLSVAEIEAGSYDLKHDDVPLGELFTELRADYEAAARQKAIALEFNLPPKMPVIQGDRDKISLAVHNLLGNAIKYTPESGYVTVKVDVEEERVAVAVTDSGIGIADGELEQVFEKFYRARDERIAGITGSGLGLALAREVTRLHGGDITVESEINNGSTFTLELPVPKKRAA
jgi:signal transduction histidine kinase